MTKSEPTWKNLRYAILIVAIVAWLVTATPNARTMLIFMAPLLALYLLGIIGIIVARWGTATLRAGNVSH